MYFWDPGDWGTVGAGPSAGTLLMLGVGRAIFWTLVGHEVWKWIW